MKSPYVPLLGYWYRYLLTWVQCRARLGSDCWELSPGLGFFGMGGGNVFLGTLVRVRECVNAVAVGEGIGVPYKQPESRDNYFISQSHRVVFVTDPTP